MVLSFQFTAVLQRPEVLRSRHLRLQDRKPPEAAAFFLRVVGCNFYVRMKILFAGIIFHICTVHDKCKIENVALQKTRFEQHVK